MMATLIDYFDEVANVDERKVVPEPQQSKQTVKSTRYRPETDIVLWLGSNAPLIFQEMVDLRYCLYHRCSRAGYSVTKTDKDDFKLKGRHSSLHIVSNKARRYLLWKLRVLARELGWRGALPRTRAALTSLALRQT
jgi:hypothetical protein